MMLGLLLARGGVDVVVLEKHADFLRDFRGDTIHPSTLEVVHELGLLDDLLARPHQRVSQLRARIGDVEMQIADFSRLPVRCPFIMWSLNVSSLRACSERKSSKSHWGMKADLRAVQQRRAWPTRITQRGQLTLQSRVIRPLLDGVSDLSLPLSLRLMQRWPWLTRLPGRLIGLGALPEHVRPTGPDPGA